MQVTGEIYQEESSFCGVGLLEAGADFEILMNECYGLDSIVNLSEILTPDTSYSTANEGFIGLRLPSYGQS